MPPLRDFILKLGVHNESICSVCCKTIRPSREYPTLAEAEANHACALLNLNTNTR